MTKQILLERIPPSIFPYSTYVTTMPDPDGLALSISTIESHAGRPSTMMRPLPTSAVVDRNPCAVPGLLPCQKMPEDINIVAAQWRLAERMSDTKVTTLHRDVHVEEISTPCIPLDTWIPVELVQRPLLNDGGDFAAATAAYKPAALYIHGRSQRVSWAVRAEEVDPVARDHRVSMFGLSSAITIMKDPPLDNPDAPDVSLGWHHEFKSSSHANIQKVLTPTPREFVRFNPIYLRHGVLLEVPIIGGLTHYLVLQPWCAEDVRGVRTDARVGQQWFNPSTMGYLAGAEYVPDDDEYSHRLWPSLAQASGLPEEEDADDPWALRRENLETYIKKTICFDLEDTEGLEGFEREFLHQMTVYTNDDNLFANISSAHAEKYLVDTGSPVLIDIMHPAMRAMSQHNARFSHIVPFACKSSPSTQTLKKGISLQDFTDDDAAENSHPVFQAMLLY